MNLINKEVAHYFNYSFKDNLINHFSGNDFMKIKESLFKLPYEKIGFEINNLFKKNFEIIKIFLNKICEFDICAKIFNILILKFKEINPIFESVKNLDDFINIIEGKINIC